MLAVNLYEFFASNAPEVEAEPVPVGVAVLGRGRAWQKSTGGPYGFPAQLSDAVPKVASAAMIGTRMASNVIF